MNTAEQILNTIDITQEIITDDILKISECCGIYEWLEQQKPVLGYRKYHSWICTDTNVGIDVWYLDDNPVCISYKPFRKATINFYWLSREKYQIVKLYIHSLQVIDDQFDGSTIHNMPDILTSAKQIDYKQFEQHYIKL